MLELVKPISSSSLVLEFFSFCLSPSLPPVRFVIVLCYQVVMVRFGELGGNETVVMTSDSAVPSDAEMSTDSRVAEVTSPLEGLFNSLTHSLNKVPNISSCLVPGVHFYHTLQWSEMSQSQQSLDSNVPEKLLSLAHVILSYWPLGQTATGTKGSIALVTEFFLDPISLLMTYATEGLWLNFFFQCHLNRNSYFACVLQNYRPHFKKFEGPSSTHAPIENAHARHEI